MTKRFNDLVFTQVINLDRSTGRLATIDAGLKTAGVDYVRLSATDGRKLDLGSDPQVTGMFDLIGWAKRHHRNPTPADIGCYLSHFRAIGQVLEQNKPYGLIFEDDADVSPDFVAMTMAAVEDTGSWDILKLHARHPGPLVVRRAYPGRPSLCSFIARHAGATAYLINHDAARKMLKHMVPAVKMNDWVYDEGHKMHLKVRTLSPMPVGLQDVQSTIEVDRTATPVKRTWLEKQTDRPILPRWQLPFRRIGDATHRLFYNLFPDGGLKAMLSGPDKHFPKSVTHFSD